MFERFDWEEILKQLKVVDRISFILKCKKERKPIGHVKLAKLVKRHRIKNVDGAFNRALGNAVKHGRCPVECQAFVGEDGILLVVIKDSGNGFDYEDMIAKLQSGKRYFKGHGKGGRTYNENRHSKVSWSNGGSTIAILYNHK